MTGGIGILNVGAGDTKLVFDKDNPAECIRAARIVRDMLRRGYALLIEVPDGKGGTTTERVRAFREDTFEYIIADLDPDFVQAADELEQTDGKGSTPEENNAPDRGAPVAKPGRGRPRVKSVPATGTSGVAVARTAGG